MAIIPGTTPTLTVALDASVSDCTAAELCIRCEGAFIRKTLPDLLISGDGTEVGVKLTQRETLLLPDNRIALVQLRVLIGSAVLATEVMQVSTSELLHRKELIADADK